MTKSRDRGKSPLSLRPPLACAWIGAIAVLLAARSGMAQTTPKPPNPWLAEHLGELVELYTHLHTHPELSYHEVETSKRIAGELEKAGAKTTSHVGKLGVVGVLENGPGPVVLVRTDMDALPVTEETNLPYASKVKVRDQSGREVGVMHACGHDVHMTCLIGTARWLASHRDRWAGTVLFIGQPAEEAIDGARSMLDAGLYKRFPKPKYALALHCASDVPVGSVAYVSGPTLASSTSLLVTIRGKGGHGAWPHRTVDPVVLSALLILDLQTIVSREVEPIEPAVVTVGSIHGGTKHNIIPDEVKLQLTLRSFSEPVRELLVEAIKRRATSLAAAHRAPEPSVVVEETTPPTINSPDLVERVVPAFVEALGAAHVKVAKPVMGAEDFGLFGEGGIPIFMFWLGTQSPERIAAALAKNEPLPALHSARFAPEAAAAIDTGVRAMTAAVIQLLPPKSP